MTGLKMFALALLTLMLAACSSVYSPQPFGEQVVSIDADRWDGHWVTPDGLVVIKTLDAEQGVLRVKMTEGEDVEIATVHLRISGDWTFASLQVEAIDDEESPPASPIDETDSLSASESSGPSIADTLEASRDSSQTETPAADSASEQTAYAWFKVKNDGDYLILWPPDVAKFKALVKDGTFPGTTSDEDYADVFLEALSPEQYRIITRSEKGLLMKWEEPVVLMRRLF